jgi:conjugative transfer pilus assembly protein TraH
MKHYLSILLICISGQCFASIADDLNSSFNRMGFAGNITPTGAYRGQEGVMAFGGSAYMRAPNRSLQPWWFQPPGFGVDDCSMDLHLGGFGFVDAKKFVEMARAIGSSAGAYLFTLALKQVAPQIANQMEALQNMANEFNQFNMDSCNAAKYFVDKGIDIIKQSSNRTCQEKGLLAETNDHGQWFRAKEECTKPGSTNRLNKEAAEDPNFKDSVIVDKNIAWHAIQNNPTLAALPDETKYLLMSLTGTIIVTTKSESDTPSELVYTSKLNSDTSKLLEGLARATDGVEIWACKSNETTKCLALETRTIRIDNSKTFYGEVRKILKSIEDKVRNEEELSEGEKVFIEKTDLEVYKLIKLQTAFSRNIPLSFINEYVEVVALEMLYQYLEQCVGDVMQAFNNSLLPEKYTNKFMDMMQYAKDSLHKIRVENASRSTQRREMLLRVNSMQNQLTSNLSSQIFSKMSWGKNLRGM